jgi:hypothetical protein
METKENLDPTSQRADQRAHGRLDEGGNTDIDYFNIEVTTRKAQHMPCAAAFGAYAAA